MDIERAFATTSVPTEIVDAREKFQDAVTVSKTPPFDLLHESMLVRHAVRLVRAGGDVDPLDLWPTKSRVFDPRGAPVLVPEFSSVLLEKALGAQVNIVLLVALNRDFNPPWRLSG
jgi:hypothetical protein